MRSHEKFVNAWKSLEWWVNFHKTSVWLVPTEDDYKLSVIKPSSQDLPIGTAANKYNPSLEITDTLKAL